MPLLPVAFQDFWTLKTWSFWPYQTNSPSWPISFNWGRTSPATNWKSRGSVIRRKRARTLLEITRRTSPCQKMCLRRKPTSSMTTGLWRTERGQRTGKRLFQMGLVVYQRALAHRLSLDPIAGRLPQRVGRTRWRGWTPWTWRTRTAIAMGYRTSCRVPAARWRGDSPNRNQEIKSQNPMGWWIRIRIGLLQTLLQRTGERLEAL